MARSVRTLCTADHRGDEALIARWLRGKDAAGFAARIDAGDGALLCAEGAGGTLLGFGHIDAGGEIQLLYVDPDARGLGAGAALLAALERHAAQRGVRELRLEATVTAEPFYQRHGYAAGCRAERADGLRCMGMTKTLA